MWDKFNQDLNVCNFTEMKRVIADKGKISWVGFKTDVKATKYCLVMWTVIEVFKIVSGCISIKTLYSLQNKHANLLW